RDYEIKLPQCPTRNLRYYATGGYGAILHLRFDADVMCAEQFLKDNDAGDPTPILGRDLVFNAEDSSRAYGWEFQSDATYDDYSDGPARGVQYDIVVSTEGTYRSIYLEAFPA